MMFPLPLPNTSTIWNSFLFAHMLWASTYSLLLHIKWRTCLAILAWQKLSAFVCLTVDPHENCCYFGWTQCISSIYSKGNFQEKAVAGQTIVDLRNVPSGMGNLSLPQNFLLLTKYLLVICILLPTVWKEQKRAVNLEYIESTVCFLWILFWSKEEINLLMLLTHRMKFSNTDVLV